MLRLPAAAVAAAELLLLLLLLLLLAHQAGGSDLHLLVDLSTGAPATAQTLVQGTLCWGVLLLGRVTGATLRPAT
jgi:hypothetical protein